MHHSSEATPGEHQALDATLTSLERVWSKAAHEHEEATEKARDEKVRRMSGMANAPDSAPSGGT